MVDEYSSLTRFVRKYIVDTNLALNPLRKSTGAVASYLRHFKELGWTSTLVPNSPSHRKIITPDGKEYLTLVGGKAYRHPEVTERICKSKHVTKKFLELSGLATPAGVDLAIDEFDVAAALFAQMRKPIVVKPTNAGGSQGVTVGVYSDADFNAAWRHALDTAKHASRIIMEEHVPGVELRAYVVGSEVAGVAARIQPFVVGDGGSTIEDLVSNLKQERRVNFRLEKFGVYLDWDFISKQGHSSGSVPTKNEIVFLNPLTLPTRGALQVDLTDQVSKEIKQMAVRSTRAIPHLEVAGIDLLVEDLRDASTARVVEVNTSAAVDLHRYPSHGAPRSVEAVVVDYYRRQYLEETNT